MTEAQAKARLEAARRKVRHFGALRNFWRSLVHRRLEALHRVREGGARLRGNYVEGGTLEQRIALLFRVAPSVFRAYYSEEGLFADFRWAIHNVPRNQWRSDCSSWARDVVLCVKAMGGMAARIIGAGGAFYTGWVVANCQEVSRKYAETHIGTAVVYGTGTGFHMGLSLGNGSRTIEHGTPTLDYGSFDEFGEGTEVRYFAFLT